MAQKLPIVYSPFENPKSGLTIENEIDRLIFFGLSQFVLDTSLNLSTYELKRLPLIDLNPSFKIPQAQSDIDEVYSHFPPVYINKQTIYTMFLEIFDNTTINYISKFHFTPLVIDRLKRLIGKTINPPVSKSSDRTTNFFKAEIIKRYLELFCNLSILILIDNPHLFGGDYLQNISINLIMSWLHELSYVLSQKSRPLFQYYSESEDNTNGFFCSMILEQLLSLPGSDYIKHNLPNLADIINIYDGKLYDVKTSLAAAEKAVTPVNIKILRKDHVGNNTVLLPNNKQEIDNSVYFSNHFVSGTITEMEFRYAITHSLDRTQVRGGLFEKKNILAYKKEICLALDALNNTIHKKNVSLAIMFGIMYSTRSGFDTYTDFISNPTQSLSRENQGFASDCLKIYNYLDEFQKDLQKDILRCKLWFNDTTTPVPPPSVTSATPTPAKSSTPVIYAARTSTKPSTPLSVTSTSDKSLTLQKLSTLMQNGLEDTKRHYRIRNTKSIFNLKEKLEALQNYITTIEEYFKLYNTLPDDLKTEKLTIRGNIQIAEKQLLDSYNSLSAPITDAKLSELYQQYDETLNKKGGNNKDYYKLYLKYKTKYIRLKSSIA